METDLKRDYLEDYGDGYCRKRIVRHWINAAGNLWVDGLFRPRKVSVLEMVTLGNCSHTDSAVAPGFTAVKFKLMC